MRGHPVSRSCLVLWRHDVRSCWREEARNGIMSGGALTALLEMSNSGNADVRILCGAIICRLSSEVDRSEEIVQAGAVPSLITLSNWTHFPTTTVHCVHFQFIEADFAPESLLKGLFLL